MKKQKQYDDVLWKFFQLHKDYWSSYRDNAEVVWAGEHYLMIRTGMSENKSRYVWLVDKAGLLYDDEAPALVQIAAGVHPVQAERAEHPELLHESNQQNGEGIFKGRWCKARKRQCIKYAKAVDSIYEDKLPEWIDAYEERKREEKALKAEERQFAARITRFARKEAQKVGLRVKNDCAWDKGEYADRKLETEDTLDSDILFSASHNEWKVRLHHQSNLISLTESQFKRYIRLLCKFHAENIAEEEK
jgi:hypothetical protein